MSEPTFFTLFLLQGSTQDFFLTLLSHTIKLLSPLSYFFYTERDKALLTQTETTFPPLCCVHTEEEYSIPQFPLLYSEGDHTIKLFHYPSLFSRFLPFVVFPSYASGTQLLRFRGGGSGLEEGRDCGMRSPCLLLTLVLPFPLSRTLLITSSRLICLRLEPNRERLLLPYFLLSFFKITFFTC